MRLGLWSLCLCELCGLYVFFFECLFVLAYFFFWCIGVGVFLLGVFFGLFC